MANITPYNPLTLEGVDESEAGQQRFLFVQGLEGTVVSEPDSLSHSVLVEDSEGNLQRALAVVPISNISTQSVDSINGQIGVAVLDGTDIQTTVDGTEDTVENHLNTIKTDLGDLGDSVTDLNNDAVLKSKTSSQSINSPISVKDEFNISDGLGNSFQVSMINGIATIATNDGLDVISKANFAETPTVEGDKNYESLASDELTSKKQVAQAISSVTGRHFDKWVLSGTPENLTLTESLQPVYMPATKRFPSLPPSSMEANANGTGIIFKNAGLIHFKRNVSLAGSNVGNIYYQARINGQEIAELNAQSVSISENTMSYTVEFFWEVSANQEMTIWANSVDGNVPLNYRGVTTIVEYL